MSAELVDVPLTLSPATATQNTLDLTVDVSAIGDSSDTSQTSGTIEARIEIDPETGIISTLEFVEADIEATGVTFSAGGFFSNYSLSSFPAGGGDGSLGGTLDTPAPPAPVTNGQSPAELHEFTINSGIIAGSANVIFVGSIDVDEDLAATPVSGTGMVGEFITLSSTNNAAESTASVAVYDLDLSYPLSIMQVVDIGSDLTEVTISAQGSLNATGRVELALPNPYLDWATANGNAAAAFSAFDFSPLLPNGLLWSLGYQGGEAPDTLCTSSNNTSFDLALPASGTVNDVVVQSSNDLSDPNAWTNLATIPAASTLSAGPFSAGGDRHFFRLLTTDPSS